MILKGEVNKALRRPFHGLPYRENLEERDWLLLFANVKGGYSISTFEYNMQSVLIYIYIYSMCALFAVRYNSHHLTS